MATGANTYRTNKIQDIFTKLATQNRNQYLMRHLHQLESWNPITFDIQATNLVNGEYHMQRDGHTWLYEM